MFEIPPLTLVLAPEYHLECLQVLRERRQVIAAELRQIDHEERRLLASYGEARATTGPRVVARG